jgi:hypothetical protein
MNKIIGSYSTKRKINGVWTTKEFFVLAIESPKQFTKPLCDCLWEVKFQTTEGWSVKYFQTEADAVVWIQKVKAA